MSREMHTVPPEVAIIILRASNGAVTSASGCGSTEGRMRDEDPVTLFHGLQKRSAGKIWIDGHEANHHRDTTIWLDSRVQSPVWTYCGDSK